MYGQLGCSTNPTPSVFHQTIITPFPHPLIYQLFFLCVHLCCSGVHLLFLTKEHLYLQTYLGFILLLLFRLWRGSLSQRASPIFTLAVNAVTSLQNFLKCELRPSQTCTRAEEGKAKTQNLVLVIFKPKNHDPAANPLIFVSTLTHEPVISLLACRAASSQQAVLRDQFSPLGTR